jgi:hypothetical protein
MKEYKITPDREFQRRHFQDEHFDLMVWLKGPEQVHGFQVTYMTNVKGVDTLLLEERVVTYVEGKGLKFSSVENEDRDLPTYKLLVKEDEQVPKKWIKQYLRDHKADIPDFIFRFITLKLM